MSPTVSNSSSASRRVLVIIALVIFIVALVLVIVSSMMPGAKKKSGNTYADGYKTAREQAYLSGAPKMTAQGSIVGTVESVSSDSVMVKTNLFVDARVDGIGQVRTVKINSSTKIVRQMQKSNEQMRKEQKDFADKASKFNAGDKMITPPMPYEEKEIKISEIKQGDVLSVLTGGSDDLTLVDQIQATVIKVTTATSPEIQQPK